MHWDEVHLFDADQTNQRGFYGIWTIPANRMKTKVEHRVPITAPMRELLKANEASEGLVFSAANGRILSDMTLSALMKRIHLSDDGNFVDQRSQRPAVPHGLQSTLRDWVAEHGKSREAAELQLAHKFGSPVEHAYYGADLLDKRARLMMQ